VSRSICPDIRAVASFAIANERHLASSPAEHVRTFLTMRLRDPRAAAADLIGGDAVHKFAEAQVNAVSQRPSRAECIAIIQAAMPNLSRAVLQPLNDDFLLELAVNVTDMLAACSRKGGETPATFSDKIRSAWATKHGYPTAAA
jgi:hypothetical protein